MLKFWRRQEIKNVGFLAKEVKMRNEVTDVEAADVVDFQKLL